MKYEHIWRYVAATPWAITPEKLAELLAVLQFRAAGGVLTAEEIRAAMGDQARPMPSGRGVAVIPLRGVIAHRMGTLQESSGGMSAERFSRLFRAAYSDPSVGAVVIDVDSPGGTVPGIHEAASDAMKLRQAGTKRVVAVANSQMASAAYWLAAAAADELVAIPSATVGSIGVFAAHLMEEQAVAERVTLISAGKYKTEGNPFEPLSDEAKAHLQDRVDDAYSRFVQDVAKGRGVPVAAVRGGYGEGRALGAKAALEAGLIDRIGTLEETVHRLASGRSVAPTRERAELDDVDLARIAHDEDADLLERIER